MPDRNPSGNADSGYLQAHVSSLLTSKSPVSPGQGFRCPEFRARKVNRFSCRNIRVSRYGDCRPALFGFLEAVRNKLFKLAQGQIFIGSVGTDDDLSAL